MASLRYFTAKCEVVGSLCHFKAKCDVVGSLRYFTAKCELVCPLRYFTANFETVGPLGYFTYHISIVCYRCLLTISARCRYNLVFQMSGLESCKLRALWGKELNRFIE